MSHISEVIGKTMSDVWVSENKDKMVFTSTCRKHFIFYHEQDCCEHVSIDDICGDLSDLVGSPILTVEEVCSEEFNKDYSLNKQQEEDGLGDHYTWTFYKFSTIKGSVTVRWLGSSNGYYSESVDFMMLKE